MANQKHRDLLKQGVEIWNQWREEHRDIQPDLSYADLSGTDLSGADLSGADIYRANLNGANLNRANLNGANLFDADLMRVELNGANLRGASLFSARLSGTDLRRVDLRGVDLRGVDLIGANLHSANLVNAQLNGANLSGANLTQAHLDGANFYKTNLSGANLTQAHLDGANLYKTNLSGANLSGANLTQAILIQANLTRATLSQCSIYGISVWDVQMDGATQDSLIITPDDEPTITVDNLKIAQFIYLLLNNAEIREVIDTITSKVVLILGRFTPERKAALDAIREELRKRNYSPIVFDFEKPVNRDITETISTLAHMARFVIADITDAKSIPQELTMIVPNLPSVPVQPLILTSQHEYGMFEHFTRYPWVLPVYHYTDEASLLKSLQENVISPAEQKAMELAEQ